MEGLHLVRVFHRFIHLPTEHLPLDAVLGEIDVGNNSGFGVAFTFN